MALTQLNKTVTSATAATKAQQLQEDFMHEIQRSDFDPEAYLRTRHILNDQKMLLAFRSVVQSIADSTNQEAKHRVFENYQRFLETAPVISNLENELYLLNNHLMEQRKLLESLQNMSFTGIREKEVKKPKFSSRSAEDRRRSMQQVVEKVHGVSWLMENSNRYLVLESDLVELDNDNFNSIRQMHAILLNDMLLITTLIPHQMGPMRYKFEERIEVDQLSVVNVPNDSRVRDAFKPQMFPYPKVFQAENYQLKRKWLDSLEFVRNEFLQAGSLARQNTIRLRSQRQQQQQQQSNVTPTAKVDTLQNTRESGASENEGEWLRELPDELEVCIAQRDFEAAVELLQEGREQLLHCSDPILAQDVKGKLHERERNLSDVLCREIAEARGGPKASRRAVSLLVQLGQPSKAIELFLKQRSQVLKQSVRELKMLDAPLSYVQELCRLVFGTVESVTKDVTKLFLPKHASCAAVLALWASGELRLFVQQLVKAVLDAGPSLGVIAQCILMVHKYMKKLDDVGLDLRFELEKLLDPHIMKALVIHRDNAVEALRLRINEDRWQSSNLQSSENMAKFLTEMKEFTGLRLEKYVFDDVKLWITEQISQFGRAIVTLMEDLEALIDATKSSEIEIFSAEALRKIWKMELQHVQKAKESTKIPAHVLKLNLEFLNAQILSRCSENLQEFAQTEFPSIVAKKIVQMESIGDV